LPITNGARVIDSTPPAIAKSISPARIARAAAPTASRPEAHSRLSVTPGTDRRQARQQQRHARDVAVVLAGLVGAAEIDLVDRDQSSLALGAAAIARTSAPIGVRTASQMNTSRIESLPESRFAARGRSSSVRTASAPP
jgi:hypothetical protein